MAPPGGRSNNIFGGYEEEKKATTTNASVPQTAPTPSSKPELTSHQHAAANKYHNVHGANIFGHDDDRKTTISSTTPKNESTSSAAKQEMTSHQHAALNKYHNVHGTDIFGAHEASNNNKQSRNDNSQNNLFGEVKQVVTSPVVETAPPAVKTKKRIGYNLITGKAYEEEDDEKEKIKQAHVAQTAALAEQTQAQSAANNYHSSSRVLQPPGGRSTKLW